MTEPQVIVPIMVTHIRPLLCLWAYGVKTQLHRCRLPDDTQQILSQSELPDVAPEAAVIEVRCLGLRIDEEISVDCVGDIQG